MTQYCLVWLWLVFGVSPKNLILEDGQRIPLSYGYKITRKAFCYRDFRNQFFLVPNRFVDFQKTFALPKKPKPKLPPGRSRHEIPWDHPNFRDKMKTHRTIEITSKDLKTYGRRRSTTKKERAKRNAAEKAPPETAKKQKKKPAAARKSRGKKAATSENQSPDAVRPG